ncbi:thioredoxin-like domain-containing protein [Flavobacterium sp. WV_118_3]|jgi:hypothetical protein|uniref:TlpA family protein disulfide reductase n=1 Tax=Flavobacterium sp. WV_118_3 TaxID=3151764 RepID=UPI00321A3B5A
MFAHIKNVLLPLSTVLICSLTSCNKKFESDNYTAYFGGEIINPLSRYVLLCKDNKVLDTLILDEKNRFFKKFDSLTPGMYTFRHDPEYQYIYFDKNDSLMVRINTGDFDNSIVFCGRGDQKNNFLMEMYLKNESDKNNMFDLFDRNYDQFSKSIDSIYARKKAFYLRKKTEINWDDKFDLYAKASLDFNHLAKKEIYPFAHERRTGEVVSTKLPKDYYNFRKEIDFNNAQLTNYSPFVRYLTAMLNNVAYSEADNTFNLEETAIENNIKKLNIADTLFKNEKIKNSVLNNIAFMYLLEDQNMHNKKKFFDRYSQLSTDNSGHNEIKKIGDAIQMLTEGKKLPDADLINEKGEKIDLNSITDGKQTVLFFWTSNAKAHMVTVHKKVNELKKKHPNLHFVSINVDDSEQEWKQILSQYAFENTTELHSANFEALKDHWVITKIQRTILLQPNGMIKNAFISLFDSDFEKNLK